MGLHLYVFTEGHQQPDRIIERYFDETLVVDVSLQGASTDDRVLSYAVDQLCYPSLSGLTGAMIASQATLSISGRYAARGVYSSLLTGPR